MQPLKGQYTFLLQFFAYLCICNLSNGRCTRNNTSNISTVGGIRNLFSRHDNINTEKDSKGHHGRYDRFNVTYDIESRNYNSSEHPKYDDNIRHINHHNNRTIRTSRKASNDGNKSRNSSRSGNTKSNKKKSSDINFDNINLNNVHFDLKNIGLTRLMFKKWRKSKRGNQPRLLYFGGPVISNVQVYTIFYGNVTYKNELNTYYKDIVNSTYIDWLNEYNTPTQSIGRGSFIGSYLHTDNIKPVIDDTADITPLLYSLIQSGKTHPNKNTLYTIHLAPGISITKQKAKSCIDFCGYHGTLDISKIYSDFPYLYYTIIPDLSGACNGVCGGSMSVFDNTCSIASHELVEAITDPGVGLGKLAWYDPVNSEISDICNMQHDVLMIDKIKYTVQKQWSNSQKSCIIRKVNSGSLITKTEVITKTVYAPTKTVVVTVTRSSGSKCIKM